ncbi:DUF6053 domain-containing protein [Lysobacter enzymogenes]|uniref:DUF6053 domain-containing protein n=1 Tax=Lysobacter enzymogenes TaxID=69 RepID=UPI00374A5A91
MGGPSGPMPFFQAAAIRHDSPWPEDPPTANRHHAPGRARGRARAVSTPGCCPPARPASR